MGVGGAGRGGLGRGASQPIRIGGHRKKHVWTQEGVWRNIAVHRKKLLIGCDDELISQ